MQLFVTILHIALCISLILIILLQPGKEGAAAFGGGGGNQMYGPRGSGHFLGRATTVVAALFMFTSITLALYSSTRIATDSDLEDGIDQLDGPETNGFDVQLPTGTAATPPEPTPAELAPAELAPAELAPAELAPAESDVPPGDNAIDIP